MFGRNKNKPAAAGALGAGALRDTLFGDMPMSLWPPQASGANDGPFAIFAQARGLVANRRAPEAIELWRSITATKGLESRHYLQAWHFLRQNGVQPPADVSKNVYGVIVEVGMPEGLDVLAAYADMSARYLNHAGGAVIWDHPDASLNLTIAMVLGQGERIAKAIGPWDKERPGPVGRDQVRLSMLTPSGLHFGQGPISVLSSDPFSAPLFAAATKLLQALTEKAKPR